VLSLGGQRLEYRFVEVRLEGAIAIVTINDPPANTLTYHLVLQLEEAFVDVLLDPGVRAVVITGAGSRFFCGGVNITMLANVSDHYKSNFLVYAGEVFQLIEGSEALVVAAINGHVTGGGLEVGLVADRRVATEGSYNFGFPEVRLGVIPGLGGTQRLARLVGHRRALELITHGEFLPVTEAKRLGIIDAVLPRSAFLAKALEYTEEQLASHPPRTGQYIERGAWRAGAAGLAGYERQGKLGVIKLTTAHKAATPLQALWSLNQAILAARYDEEAEALLIVFGPGALGPQDTPDCGDGAASKYAKYIGQRIQNTPRLCALGFEGPLGPLASELALACDFRLIPVGSPAHAPLFNIAPNELLTVELARERGLVRVQAADSWPSSALDWMSRFTSPRAAAKAIGYAKLAIVRGTQFPEEAGRLLEWHLQEQLFRGPDASEGMRAYLEKRTPTFRGE
jgi:enoyl-CoA hydratase/carnithine racemase